MPSRISEMIQTIVSLQELQMRKQAQLLAQQQFGLQQQQFRAGQQQQSLTGLGQFQNLLQGSTNPQAFLPQVPQLAQNFGVDQTALQTVVETAAPAAATTQGVLAVRAAQDPTAALYGGRAAIGAPTPGEASRDELLGAIFSGARGAYGAMRPQEQSAFSSRVLERLGSGQTRGDVAMEQELLGLPPEARRQMLLVGKGLAPGATDDAQLRLGWARYRLDYNQALLAGRGKDGLTEGARFSQIEYVNKLRAELIDNLTKSGATLTPEGREIQRQTLNSYNMWLRILAPEVYGPQGTNPTMDLPQGRDISTNSALLRFLSGARP